jgi:thiamine pyrophosphate-dependent acetolactate synthase large subunit-like protein
MAPVLAIASHIPTSEVGSGYLQETHPDCQQQHDFHIFHIESAISLRHLFPD